MRAITQEAQPVIGFLVRTAQDFSFTVNGAREEPLVWLGRTIAKGEADDPSLLDEIELALPHSSVVLRWNAVHVTRLILQRLRKLGALSSTPDAAQIALSVKTARILGSLAVRLSAVGQRDEALAMVLEAVMLYRRLVERERDAFCRI